MKGRPLKIVLALNSGVDPVILPTRSVNVMFKLLDCEFTIADDVLDEVADGDKSNELSIIDHWEI